MNRDFIYLNGKAIGWVEDCEFYTPKRPEHIMRKFGDCFGMNVEVLAYLRDKGFEAINFLFEYKDSKIDHYVGTVTQFLKSSHEYEWGGEVQKFVRLVDLMVKPSGVAPCKKAGLGAFFP